MKSVIVAAHMAILEVMIRKCQRMGLQWRRLDGSMTAAARDIAVQDFRQLEGVKFFMRDFQAGGRARPKS